MVRRYVLLWLTCRVASKPSGRNWAKQLGVSHTWLQKVKAFTDVEDKFDNLYNTNRYQRNEAGHPRDIPYAPDIPQAKAMLLSFGVYCKAVYDILAIS